MHKKNPELFKINSHIGRDEGLVLNKGQKQDAKSAEKGKVLV